MHRWATCPNWQQLSHWENLLAGTIGVTFLGPEKRRIEDPIAGASCGLTETVTEVASLPCREVGSGLRNLAERMATPLAFRTEVARASKRSSGLVGRYEMGREWMASCVSLGASLKGSQGGSPTGKDWLSREVMASKKGA